MIAFLLDTFWFRAARLAPASWFRLSQGSRRQSFVAWIYDRSHAAAKRRFREQLPYLESGDAAGLSTLARVLLFLLLLALGALTGTIVASIPLFLVATRM